MFILEEYLYSLKMKFNNSVKRLRLEKEELINLITNYNGRITIINGELGVDEKLFNPIIDNELEYPEKFYDVTPDELEVYRIKKAKKAGKKIAKKDSKETEETKKKKVVKRKQVSLGDCVPKKRNR